MGQFIDYGNFDFLRVKIGFSKRIVLCGINYNKSTSKHEVEMEVIEADNSLF